LESTRKAPEILKNRLSGATVTFLIPDAANAKPVIWRSLGGMQIEPSDKQQENAKSPSSES
jgi:hypothetical protein